MAYLLLNLSHLLFGFPFGFQITVIRNLSDFLLDCSLHFVEAALDLVFRAGVHIFSPWPRKMRVAALSEPLSGLSFLFISLAFMNTGFAHPAFSFGASIA